MFVEVIVVSVQEAELAEECGANRVEFVEDLHVGGLTPNMGRLSHAARRVSIPINVMIRPRAGGFEYTSREMEEMRRSALSAQEAGARGLVMGFLREGRLDKGALEEALRWCPSMDFTFHRAIDEALDPLEVAGDLADFQGVTDLLTSGGPGPIEGNVDRIKRIRQMLKGVRVMAGGGITVGNVRSVIDATGVEYVHLGRSVRMDNSPFGLLDEERLRRMIRLVKGEGE